MKRIHILILSFIMVILVTMSVLYYTGASAADYFTTGWFFLIALLLWLGNRFLAKKLDSFFPWHKAGTIRYFIHLLLGIFLSLLIVNISYFTLKYILTVDPPTYEQIIVMNVWGAILFIPIFSVYFSLHFLKYWRKAELEVEKFQKESIRSQLESLKNHLDPHFLFNNLNILSSLIDKDKALSKTFLEKFGDVYRSLLRTKADDLITLHDEFEFIKSYIFLITIRFEQNIQFELNIPQQVMSRMLPPLTLQMLTENAIKHNIITESKPLRISYNIDTDNNLIVTNTINTKNTGKDGHGGSGLTAIQKRYEYFTDKPVQIEQTETSFTVKVPLLEIEVMA